MSLPLRRSCWITLSTLIVFWGSACAGTRYNTGKAPQAYLLLDIEPTSAKVYIDDRYQGQVQGWTQQTVPVQPGLRRVELRAAGYISQRFDLKFAHNEEVSLSLKLERTLDEVDDDPQDPSAKPTP